MIVSLSGGETVEIGATETTPTISITDYSRRVTDDFGVTTVVKRGFARRLSVRLALPTDTVDVVQRRLADLRATSAIWIADDRFAWLSAAGFYKEFELNLAVPPLAFCTLTVEGVTETEVAADTGEDPAPDGQTSSLQLLRPLPIDDGVLLSSNVPENDAPAWSGAATYALAGRVVRAHRVFESLIPGNVGKEPIASPAAWLDLGPTNRSAMFDQALGTSTVSAGQIVVTLPAGQIGAIALLDVVGATVRVQAQRSEPPHYDRTMDVTGGAITFLDILGVPSGNPITVTITGGAVSVGTLLAGDVVGLGVTEAAPTAGITDFSRKEVDEFGEATIVERAWAKRMSTRALIRTDALDVVANRVAGVRALPCLWIGDVGLDSLTVYGFFKDFSIEVGPAVSTLSLSIEGLSKAVLPPPLKIDWTNVTDGTGTKPADNATNSADPTSPFGSQSVQETIDAIAARRAEIAQLEAEVGVAIDAAIEQANTGIATARDEAGAARSRADAAFVEIDTQVVRIDERIDAVTAGAGDDDAAIYAEVSRVDTASLGRDAALGQSIQTVSATIETTDVNLRALVETKEQAAVNRENAISQRVDTLVVESGNPDQDAYARSEIVRVDQAAISRDEILATSVQTVSASIGPAINAKATEITTAYTDADTTLAERATAIEAAAGNLTSRVAATETATTDGRFATAQRAAAIEAAAGNLTTRVGATEIAITDGRFATAQRASAIEAAAGNLTARVAGTETAITDGRFASSQRVDNVEVTANGASASASSTAAALVTTDGRVATALARAAVTLDVNDYVTGWETTNNGSSGSFVVRTDRFSIVAPAGGARTEFSNGNWRVYDAAGNLRVRLGVW